MRPPPPSPFSLIPFWAKAAMGMLGFALTPVACVAVLARENHNGTLQQPNIREALEGATPKLRLEPPTPKLPSLQQQRLQLEAELRQMEGDSRNRK